MMPSFIVICRIITFVYLFARVTVVNAIQPTDCEWLVRRIRIFFLVVRKNLIENLYFYLIPPSYAPCVSVRLTKNEITGT